jgi:hypothetical protein
VKAYWVSGGISSRIRWTWVVSFTPRSLYPQGKRPWYSLDRRLCGRQSRSGRGGEEKNSQTLPSLEPPIIQPVAQRYTTELSRLFKFILNTLHLPVMYYLVIILCHRYRLASHTQNTKLYTRTLNCEIISFILFVTTSRPALTPGVRRPWHEAPSNAEDNAWSYTSTPQYVFTAWCLI